MHGLFIEDEAGVGDAVDTAEPALEELALVGTAFGDAGKVRYACFPELPEELLGVAGVDGGKGLGADDAVSGDTAQPLQVTDGGDAAVPVPVNKHVGNGLALYVTGAEAVPVIEMEDIAPLGFGDGAQVCLVRTRQAVVEPPAYEGGKGDAAHGGTATVCGVVSPAAFPALDERNEYATLCHGYLCLRLLSHLCC